MTRDDIIRMAREAGFKDMAEAEYWHPLFKQFAALVVANIDPKSFMSWQEGYEAGRVAEREECAKVCEALDPGMEWSTATDCATAIRARGQA